MTKQTTAKLSRTFKVITETGIHIEVKPPHARHVEICRRCGGVMWVSDGQIANFHKECREIGRRSGNR